MSPQGGLRADARTRLKKACDYVKLDIYCRFMNTEDKPLIWLHGEIKTPPFSPLARIETGVLLRRLQRGQLIPLPHSRSMPSIGPRCHELRIHDIDATWRMIYRLDSDAVIIGEVFSKKTTKTPKKIIDICKRRFQEYDE